jgi:hypothetical protein
MVQKTVAFGAGMLAGYVRGTQLVAYSFSERIGLAPLTP